MSVRVLDCTLRDGGYYNSWRFSDDLVADYLGAVSRAGVDFVEIGFRNFPQPSFVGPYAYSTDIFLETLPIPDDLNIGVMIDAKTVLTTPDDPVSAVEKLFSPREESRVSLVRIAAHFDQVANCRPVVERLKFMGYLVGLNIMQMAERESALVSDLARLVYEWAAVDMLYFADSLGSMDAAEVERTTVAMREGWKGPLGIHAHNNKSLAVQNSLHAMSLGVEYLDATILGMGRGAGNADLGIMLAELTHRNLRPADLVGVYSVGEKYFQPLKDEYRWGPNLFYHYSALNNIHPMFTQTLLSDRRYSAEEQFSVIESLAAFEARSFDRAEVDRLLNPFEVQAHGETNAEPADLRELTGATLLIIGAGGSALTYAKDIKLFIEQHHPTVLTLNHQASIEPELVDGVICVDQHRLACETDFLATCNKPIYTAQRLLSPSVRERLENADLRQYDCILETDSFAAHDGGCVIPVPLAFGYALALCISAKVKRIFLVGFDGFSPDDSRQQQMLQLLRLAEPHRSQLAMTALTPTNYPIAQGSLYADYR
jgi:4-hydroxy 2-oxovalerate aldolase